MVTTLQGRAHSQLERGNTQPKLSKVHNDTIKWDTGQESEYLVCSWNIFSGEKNKNKKQQQQQQQKHVFRGLSIFYANGNGVIIRAQQLLKMTHVCDVGSIKSDRNKKILSEK